jgi:hypothetical protein
MSQFTLAVEGYRPVTGEIQIEEPVIQPPARQYYRVPHDVERVDWNKGDLRYRTDGSRGEPRKIYTVNPITGQKEQILNAFPEVYRLAPDHHTVLNCAFQWLWRSINPDLSDKKWSTLLGNKLAWTNNTGFPGHANCVLQEEMSKPMPRFDQARVCGGAILTGTERNGLLWIESMLINNPVMDPQDVLNDRSKWYWGTSVNPEGEVNLITRPGLDGRNYPVRVPIVTAQPVFLPLVELHKLPISAPLPDATWLPS